MARAGRPRRGYSSAWSRATALACPAPCLATPWMRRRHDSPRSMVRRRRGRRRACSFGATPRKVGDRWRRRNKGGRLYGSDWKSFSSSPGSRGGSRSGALLAPPHPCPMMVCTPWLPTTPGASPVLLLLSDAASLIFLTCFLNTHSWICHHTRGTWRRQPSSHPASAGEPRGCCATRCNCTHQEHHVFRKAKR
ncbi:hypothetical protein PAHAL_4G322500 [Panicum hallii]|uniref:Uncharacterized protein n=1 Tax=Panicum hallii TaxID=206008 RepID=A0A2T8JEP1_9POAL|nr:hypothetical protein PAHAL_4G322500 [Panicum hallii]